MTTTRAPEPQIKSIHSGGFRALASRIARNTRGAIDLASVMVGVLVIGVVGGGITATVMTVVPWAQDNAARASVSAVADAENVARAEGSKFLTSATLVKDNWIQASPRVVAGTDSTGSCYIGVAKSGSSNLYYGTDVGPDVNDLRKNTAPECVDAEELERLVTAVGGWGDIAPVEFADFDFPDAERNKAYSSTLEFAFDDDVEFTITDGALPAGLTLGKTNGTVSGTAAVDGTYLFEVTAKNDGGTTRHNYSITVGLVAPKILTGELPDGTKSAAYAATIAFTGDETFLSWGLGGHPTGLELNKDTGEITGVPDTAGTYEFTVTAMNTGGISAQAYKIVVRHTAPLITRGTLPDADRDVAYSQALTWTGEEVTFAPGLGGLPAGLTVNETTGVVSGTPTIGGTYDFTITITNSGGTSAQAFRITVKLVAPALRAGYLSGAVVGSSYSVTPGWTGEATTLSATGLPSGLTINDKTGTISGVATAAGTKTFTVTAANNGGVSAFGYSIKVGTATNLASNSSFEKASTNTMQADWNMALNPETRVGGGAGAIVNESVKHNIYIEGNVGTSPPGRPELNSGLVSSVNVGQTSNLIFSAYNLDGNGNLPTARKTGAWVYVVGTGYVARSGSGSTGTAIDVPYATWTYVAAPVAESGYNGAAFYIWKKDGSNTASGDFAIVTGITTIQAGNTGTPSADLTFSGATAATTEAKYTWTGAANASSSLRHVTVPLSLSVGASIVSESQAWSKSGSKSARVSSRYPVVGSAYADVDLGNPSLSSAAMRGKTYTMMATTKTFAARSVAPSIAHVSVLPGNKLAMEQTFAPNTVGEHEVRVTFTVPADATDTYLRLYNSAASGSADTWFDNVTIVEGIYTGPYIP